MKNIELARYGAPEVLVAVERSEPAIHDGRVRVRVSARAVNPVDAAIRQGFLAAITSLRTLPITLGFDFAGTVMETSGDWEAGQAVVGMIPWFQDAAGRGSYSPIVSVEPGWMVPLPDTVDPRVATILGLNGLTASQTVAFVEPQRGRTILVVGASGTVGALAVQLAVEQGATVLAVASAGDEEYVASLGARHVIPRGTVEEIVAATLAIAPNGVDGIVDAVPAGPELVAALADGGRFASVSAGREPAVERGIAVAAVRTQPNAEQLAHLVDRLAAGTLSVRAGRVLPIDQAAEAHRLLASPAGRGKFVLAG